jgi:membrane associated rhomboid family serine protease
VKLHRCDRCDGLWSPFSEILHLVDHARISQSIEPEVRALGRELLRHHSIVERWRSAGRVGEVLNQPVRWIHLIFYRPFGIVLPLGTDAVSSGATPVEPYGTPSIAVACGVAFVAAGGDPIRWSMVPARVFSGEGLASPLTALFMHSGLLHLLGNLFFLWLFGAAVEARLGVLRFLALYFGAGIAANAIDLATHAASTVPRLGSDGAVSAVLGAYLFLFPSASVRTFFFGAIADLPAWLYLGGWIIFQAVLARSIPVWGFVLGGSGAWVLAAASRRPGQRFRT